MILRGNDAESISFGGTALLKSECAVVGGRNKKPGYALGTYPVNCPYKKRVAGISWRPFSYFNEIRYATFSTN
jgi:hypothetical protein